VSNRAAGSAIIWDEADRRLNVVVIREEYVSCKINPDLTREVRLGTEALFVGFKCKVSGFSVDLEE
jgi:hypothetical protein